MISIDTNILVYAANPQVAQHESALQCLQRYQSSEVVLCELILMERNYSGRAQHWERSRSCGTGTGLYEASCLLSSTG